MRLALFQPDIAGNVGAAIRVAACFNAAVDVIGPCGFPMNEKKLRRAAMDYAALAQPSLFDDWAAFRKTNEQGAQRLVLMTTKGATSLWSFRFEPNDVILLGSETAGAPSHVHDAADARVFIPLAPQARSLNVSVAGAIALAEANRQFSLCDT
ncbi:MAG: TrmH family RNA methyltransferase [Pseudomonadota bacterium]